MIYAWVEEEWLAPEAGDFVTRAEVKPEAAAEREVAARAARQPVVVNGVFAL
jgi:hypothetical protein